jgi:hypothetical protein
LSIESGGRLLRADADKTKFIYRFLIDSIQAPIPWRLILEFAQKQIERFPAGTIGLSYCAEIDL